MRSSCRAGRTQPSDPNRERKPALEYSGWLLCILSPWPSVPVRSVYQPVQVVPDWNGVPNEVQDIHHRDEAGAPDFRLWVSQGIHNWQLEMRLRARQVRLLVEVTQRFDDGTVEIFDVRECAVPRLEETSSYSESRACW